MVFALELLAAQRRCKMQCDGVWAGSPAEELGCIGLAGSERAGIPATRLSIQAGTARLTVVHVEIMQ